MAGSPCFTIEDCIRFAPCCFLISTANNTTTFSYLGSMAMTGMLSMRAFSIRPIPRPVFPLMVVPMMTAWGVKSLAA